MAAPERRRVFGRAPSVASKHAGSCRAVRAEPEDRRQVAPAHHDDGCADGTDGSAQHGPDADRGSHDRRVPAAHPVAARRRAGLARHNPEPQPQRVTSMPAAPWHIPPAARGAGREAGRFAPTTIGYVHIDSCELRHADGKLHMFLAIDRVFEFTYVEFHDRLGSQIGAAFLRAVIEIFPPPSPAIAAEGSPPAPQPTTLRSVLIARPKLVCKMPRPVCVSQVGCRRANWLTSRSRT